MHLQNDALYDPDGPELPGEGGENNPPIPNTSPIPNWFYYYSQAYTPPCPIAYSVSANDPSIDDTSTSYFDPGIPDHIHLNDNVSGVRERPIFENRPGYAYAICVGTQKRYGIDSFVSAIEHEHTHMTSFQLLMSLDQTDYDNDGFPDCDRDGDGLPNSLEIQANLDPDDKFSTGSGFKDDEVYCKMTEQRTFGGPRASDWANNGLNWGRVPGQSNDPAIRRPIIYTTPTP